MLLAMACAKGDHGDPAAPEACMKGRAWRSLRATRDDDVLLSMPRRRTARQRAAGPVCYKWQCSRIMPPPARDEPRGSTGYRAWPCRMGIPSDRSGLRRNSVNRVQLLSVQSVKTTTADVYSWLIRRSSRSSSETQTCKTNPSLKGYSCCGIMDTTLHRIL